MTTYRKVLTNTEMNRWKRDNAQVLAEERAAAQAKPADRLVLVAPNGWTLHTETFPKVLA